MALLEPNWKPSRRELRQFAGIWFPAFFAIVGGIVYLAGGSPRTAAAIWAPAALLSLGALASVTFARVLYGLWMGLAFPVGWTVSHLAMGAIFYLLVTPLGWLARRLGRDRLALRAPRAAESYWVPIQPEEDVDRYFRQS